MKRREQEIHELPAVVIDTSPAAEQERQLSKDDLKFFFKHIWCHGNKRHQDSYGRIHDYLCDFLRLHELDRLADAYIHSPLRRYLPQRLPNGDYAERWLWFKTLDNPPVVQDGPEGEVSEMFQNRQWRGVICRIAGDASDECVLLPRGHLKSTLGTECHTLWEIIRDPTRRHLVQSENHGLAKKRLRNVKRQFTGNEKFRALFGNLKPPKRSEGIWSSTDIQVVCDSRLSDPTFSCYGLGSEVTGAHVDTVKLDDIVCRKNSETREQREKVREIVQNLEAVRDPGSRFIDIGTIWSDDDAHREYIRRDGHSYDTTSFIVATVRQDDGSPLWPEGFGEKEVGKRERKHRNDPFFFFCQYYNQPLADANRTFKDEWIKENKYDGVPEHIVKEKKLDVYITCDPANSTNKKSDFSACIVQGQADDGTRFILDGFRDRLSPEELPDALADIICHWQKVANGAGASFRFGIESFSFAKYIGTTLRDRLRQRGESCNIEELKHNFKHKADRISVLADPYSMGLIRWPRNGIKKDNKRSPGERYDLIAALHEEYARFSPNRSGGHDDLLDACAFAEFLMKPLEEPASVTEAQAKLEWKAYSRDEVLKEEAESIAVRGPRKELQAADSYTRGMPWYLPRRGVRYGR